MKKLLSYLGVLWASPITVFLLVTYILPLWVLSYYKFYKFDNESLAIMWKTSNMPKWLSKLWEGWAGHAGGSIVVLNSKFLNTKHQDAIIIHELEHINQCMRLGIFQPMVYLVIFIAGKVIRNTDSYSDNIFEIGARRSAGQIIDVVGARKALADAVNKK